MSDTLYQRKSWQIANRQVHLALPGAPAGLWKASRSSPSWANSSTSVGKALVCSDLEGPLSQVKPGKTALVVPVDNWERFAEAVVTLAVDNNLCRSLGAAARQLALQEFSLDTYCQRLVAMYRKVLGEIYRTGGANIARRLGGPRPRCGPSWSKLTRRESPHKLRLLWPGHKRWGVIMAHKLLRYLRMLHRCRAMPWFT